MKRKRTAKYVPKKKAKTTTTTTTTPAYRRNSAFSTLTVFQPGGTPELKSLDTAIGVAIGQALSLTGVGVLPLNNIAQGLDIVNRIGNKIIMKSIQFRVQFDLQPIAGPFAQNAGVLRFAIVYDKQTNTAPPVWADVFLEQSGVLLTGSLPLAPANLANRGRFVILWDKVIPYDSANHSYIHLKKYRQCSLPVIYNGAGGATANINSGGVFCLQVYTPALTANAAPVMSLMTRIRYNDE